MQAKAGRSQWSSTRLAQDPPGLPELSWFSQPWGSDCTAQGLWLVPTATGVCCPLQSVTAAKISEGEPRNHWRFTALKGSSSHPLWLEKLVSSSSQGTDLYLNLKTPPSRSLLGSGVKPEAPAEQKSPQTFPLLHHKHLLQRGSCQASGAG